MRFPLFGDFGRISSAAVLESSYRHVSHVAPMEHSIAAFHKSGIRSSTMRFPLFGDFGRISSAAVLESSYRHVSHVAPMEHSIAAAIEIAASRQSRYRL